MLHECQWCGDLTVKTRFCSDRCKSRMRTAIKRDDRESVSRNHHPMDQWHWFTIPHLGAWEYTLLNPTQPHEVRGYQRRTFLHE